MPLRRVAPGGRLHDYEAALLTNFLVSNRADVDGNLGGPVAAVVARHAVEMWNAMVNTIRLERTSPEALRVVVNLPAVLEKAQLTVEAAKYFRTDLVAMHKEITSVDTSL